ncbi:MAG: hypothetical protein ACR2PY_08555, partial [Salinispira sp.]
ERVMMKKVQMSDWFVNQGMEKGLAKGMQKGLAEGMERGKVEGLELGMARGIRETARSMFSEGLSAEAVQRITGLSDEEMRTVRNGSH